MRIINYTNTITDHLGVTGPEGNVTVTKNIVLVESEEAGIQLIKNWNDNASNNARNFNRTNPYRYDFVSSRPATKEEIQSMDLYAPVNLWNDVEDKKWADTLKRTLDTSKH
jgi:hypothetical protein